MQQTNASTATEIPRLIAELRRHIVRKTGKPIDPDVDFLTTQIEMLSVVRPIANEWAGLELTVLERRILNVLAARPGFTFAKEAIANAAYFDRIGDEPDMKIIDVMICKLRIKLIKARADAWIETTWGIGYKFVARNAVEANKERQSKSPHGGIRKYRESRSVEWRTGITMGRAQARIADVLHSHLGKLVASGELAKAADVHSSSLGQQVAWMTTRLTGTAYRIERRQGFGYRMVLAS